MATGDTQSLEGLFNDESQEPTGSDPSGADSGEPTPQDPGADQPSDSVDDDTTDDASGTDDGSTEADDASADDDLSVPGSDGALSSVIGVLSQLTGHDYSQYGTSVNGRSVWETKRKCILYDGDEIKIGNTIFIFKEVRFLK